MLKLKGSIYHYTSEEVAEKIISTRQFRLMHRNSLNDYSQVRSRFGLIEKKLNALALENKVNIQAWIPLLKSQFDIDSYIGCFSYKRDCPNLWAKYGRKRKGVCIEIAADRLQQDNNNPLKAYYFAPVDYGKARFVTKLDEIFSTISIVPFPLTTTAIPFASNHEYFLRQKLHLSPGYLDMRNAIAKAMAYSLLNKDSLYKNDAEIRLINANNLECLYQAPQLDERNRKFITINLEDSIISASYGR